jgi:inosine-uridine nucleoside N-ribohydrolase
LLTHTSVIIDSDPGIDDVVALALAGRSPELEIVAVTTSYGNATLAATTRNARRVLRLLDCEHIEVHPGAERPLRRQLATAPETHGESGVGYAAVEPETAASANPTVILDLLTGIRDSVTLVTLGPLTNLASALAADADLVRRRVARHIGMFGNINERGNTNRWADFNAWCDPEALHQVLQARLPTTMVGLDVTRRMTFSTQEVDRFVACVDPLVSWLGAALRFYVEFHRSQERLDGCVVNDVLPLGELLSPGLLQTRMIPLSVDLDEDEHRGHTRDRSGGALTEVAMEVDIPRMRRLLERVFGRDSGVANRSAPTHWTGKESQ